MQVLNRRRAIAVSVALTIAAASAFSGCGGDDPMEPRTLAITIAPDPIVLPRVDAVLQTSVTEEATDESRDITFDAATAYSSSNTSVAGVISSGEVIATGIGEALVIARNGAFTDTAIVRVDTLASVDVASLALTPESATLRAVDETRPTLGTIEWVNGARLRNIAGAPIAYSSSDDGVATVDASGVITARADGLAMIRATFDGGADSAAITVNTTPPVSFQTQILPLFTAGASRCTDPSCHPAVGAAQHNLRMNTYSNIMNGGSVNGPIVIPGDGASSWLVRVLRPGGAPQIGTNQMPQNKTKFSATTIGLIERWIDEGAEDN